MASNRQHIIIIQTARDWVRHWYAFDPSVIRSLSRTGMWESLFELAYSFTMIENLYFIVEVEHFFTNFLILIANIFFIFELAFLVVDVYPRNQTAGYASPSVDITVTGNKNS